MAFISPGVTHSRNLQERLAKRTEAHLEAVTAERAVLKGRAEAAEE